MLSWPHSPWYKSVIGVDFYTIYTLRARGLGQYKSSRDWHWVISYSHSMGPGICGSNYLGDSQKLQELPLERQWASGCHSRAAKSWSAEWWMELMFAFLMGVVFSYHPCISSCCRSLSWSKCEKSFCCITFPSHNFTALVTLVLLDCVHLFKWLTNQVEYLIVIAHVAMDFGTVNKPCLHPWTWFSVKDYHGYQPYEAWSLVCIWKSNLTRLVLGSYSESKAHLIYVHTHSSVNTWIFVAMPLQPATVHYDARHRSMS